jgi:hypothetical protein
MMSFMPDPWTINNTDSVLTSPSGAFKLEYGDLREVGMGAPVGGPLFLHDGGHKTLLHKWCGGPLVWDLTRNRFAIPIWTSKFFKGTVQQIAVFDLDERKAVIYKPTFNVLHFNKFHDRVVEGIISPIYKSRPLNFDTRREPMDSAFRF